MTMPRRTVVAIDVAGGTGAVGYIRRTDKSVGIAVLE